MSPAERPEELSVVDPHPPSGCARRYGVPNLAHRVRHLLREGRPIRGIHLEEVQFGEPAALASEDPEEEWAEVVGVRGESEFRKSA